MKDDFSEIVDNASCYTIASESGLYAYRNNVRYSYTKLGTKWWLRQTDNYNNVPVNSTCYSYNDIIAINSKPEFEPIFVFMALVLVVFVYWLWFNIFKRITKWKL